MTEDERRLAYAGAFIAQARSDWGACRVLEQSEVSACHNLHYLQMVLIRQRLVTPPDARNQRPHRLNHFKTELSDLQCSHLVSPAPA
jgi:hypothetical protein